MKTPFEPALIHEMSQKLSELRAEILRAENLYFSKRPHIAEEYANSAKNLVHYLALRRHDIRELQFKLSECGISSLGRSESHVLDNIDRSLYILRKLDGFKTTAPENVGFMNQQKGTAILHAQTEALFGKLSRGHKVRLMVTAPNDAAHHFSIIQDLINSGMNCLRINCARDTPPLWKKMVDHVRRAEKVLKKPCRILMDLGGPKFRTGPLPPEKPSIFLNKGDFLILSGKDKRGIPCIPPELIAYLKKGEKIWLDDGKFGGVVRSRKSDEAIIQIHQVKEGGARLKEGRGINLPHTQFPFKALTHKDIEDLKFACQHADMVGLSFIHTHQDVLELYKHLKRLSASHLGVVFKIETTNAFLSLPDIILTAMQRSPFGIMIARGDLAIEYGFERLAEVQEEILWICEAAHIPVIWGTQVLEGLVKKGMPTRAEVTDAAHGGRAECIMLNKGPYLKEALKLLNAILTRMQVHQSKKISLLSKLKW